MDDSQKDLLESAKPKLADTLDFNSIAEELQNMNLVSRDKVRDIRVSIIYCLGRLQLCRHVEDKALRAGHRTG